MSYRRVKRNNIKTIPKAILILFLDSEHIALNSHHWKSWFKKVLHTVKGNSTVLQKENSSFSRKDQKGSSTTTTHHHFPCQHCTKICGLQIGLIAHLKTHKEKTRRQSNSLQ